MEGEDQITHTFSLEEDVDGEDRLNFFKFDPFFEKTEEEWGRIKKEILGEENILRLKMIKKPEEEEGEEAGEEGEDEEEKIIDFTEKDLINLRRTVYLTIMNSVDYEECIHKLMKMDIGIGHEQEVKNSTLFVTPLYLNLKNVQLSILY